MCRDPLQLCADGQEEVMSWIAEIRKGDGEKGTGGGGGDGAQGRRLSKSVLLFARVCAVVLVVGVGGLREFCSSSSRAPPRSSPYTRLRKLTLENREFAG